MKNKVSLFMLSFLSFLVYLCFFSSLLQDNPYVEKLVNLENSVESFKEKIRSYTPAAPMIGLNCKKFEGSEDGDGKEDDDEAPSHLNDAMINDSGEDQATDISGDAMDIIEVMEVSSDSVPADS
jgi:hypothetical protein